MCRACRASRAVLFDKLDTAKMHVECDEPSGIWALLTYLHVLCCVRGRRILPVRDVQRDVPARSRDHNGACAVRSAAHRTLYSARLRLCRLLHEHRAPARPHLLWAKDLPVGRAQSQGYRSTMSTRPHHLPRRLVRLHHRYDTLHATHLPFDFNFF